MGGRGKQTGRMGGTLSLDFSRPAAAPPTPRRRGGVTNPTGSRLSSASSEEVLRQLDHEEAAIFRAVHTRIPPGNERISRLERFHEYMHENRAEVNAIRDRNVARSLRALRPQSRPERTLSPRARAARDARILAEEPSF